MAARQRDTRQLGTRTKPRGGTDDFNRNPGDMAEPRDSSPPGRPEAEALAQLLALARAALDPPDGESDPSTYGAGYAGGATAFDPWSDAKLARAAAEGPRDGARRDDPAARLRDRHPAS